VLVFQQAQLLAQLVYYLLMLADYRLLFTNLEAQLCCLHLPDLKGLWLVFLLIVFLILLLYLALRLKPLPVRRECSNVLILLLYLALRLKPLPVKRECSNVLILLLDLT